MVGGARPTRRAVVGVASGGARQDAGPTGLGVRGLEFFWRVVRGCWSPVGLALVAVVVWVVPGLSELLGFERGAVGRGEVWRVVSCHWAHWSWDHLFWDAGVLVVVGGWARRVARRGWWVCVLVSAVVVSGAVWVFLPEMSGYRGLSGIDSALFGLVVVVLFWRAWVARRWWVVVGVGAAGLGFLLKTGVEVVTGQAVFVDSAQAGVVAVPLAHAVGVGVGGVVGVVGVLGNQER